MGVCAPSPWLGACIKASFIVDMWNIGYV
jgi:hypothetical protein